VVKVVQAVRKERIGTDLTEGPIMHNLLIFAIPIVLTNLVQQLYSMVDLVIIGQYVGSIGTVGVNTGGEVADLVTPVAIGFSTAGQIFIAQLFGAKNENKIKKTVGTLLSFMMLLACVLAGMAIIANRVVLGFLNCPADAMKQASNYMIITALGYPFIFGYNAVCGILRGMGESKKPLLFILVAAVVNIVLDIILVVIFHMEAAGTAIATAVSQMGSFTAAFIFMWKRRERFDFELKLSYFKIDKEILSILIRLGIPQVVRSILVRFGMLWVNSNANAYGLVVSATNSIGNKLQKFLEVFVQGIDTASASMIGQNLGAKKIDRAGKTTLCTVVSALVCAGCTILLCIFCPHQIFGIFTKDEAVIALGATFLHIFILHFIASSLTGSFQAMVTGCGFVELGFVIGVLDGLICKIGFGILFMRVFGMGYLGLWWGVACSRILPGCICIGYFLSGKWKTRKLLTEK
jgi:putative MATE family efflux protein